MDAVKLITRLRRLRPGDETSELLRMGLLLALKHGDISELPDDRKLTQQCQEIAMQLSARSDQHAAVADELDSLAATEPSDFTPQHLWTLVRALKVQSQILNLYLGPSEHRV